MEKGYLKKEHKYFSVLLIPHSQERVKVLKFSALYSKLFTLIAVVLSVMICLAFIFIYTFQENKKLKNNISMLTNLSTDQKNLLKEKADEINVLKEKEAIINRNIKDFAEKYRDMTNKYITSRTDSIKASRAGERNDLSFVNDINGLRSILDNLYKTNMDDKTFTELSETEKKLKNYIDSLPTSWPAIGRLVSKFGDRRDPFFFRKRFHDGIDIGADFGETIRAAGSGMVTYSGWYSGYGRAVIIGHGYGLTTLYGHASKLLVKVGQIVNKGDIIAKVGSSGHSTGSHLHFEVRINDNPVDPLKYLDSKQASYGKEY